MKKCPHCSADIVESQTKCPACGLSIEDPSAETEVLPIDASDNTPTRIEEPGRQYDTPMTTSSSGSFIAGTVIASRYRIIGLVGRGGMGEVYKAEDIKLTQTVALKFLPDNYQNDSAALERFHAEVRNARQVSHPNVCRVFDIGEIEGRHFLSMEFVDGDDLSALLTRVGRFTSERGVEISRQLCVGLEAIHKAGILHRDLKPANIIIDSKGVARITDFGIAGVEAEIAGDNMRAGTPAYMSPEQINGKDVTARSDIYALGLVLYEIFTGKQAFIADNVVELIRKHQTETPTNPSEIVKGIDPLVESVIAQCLEKDPKDRPQTALRVAMALPGGNPLQIALDAGQTPSPEMVAAAPKKGTLRPIVAFALLLSVFLGFGLLIALTTRRTLQHFIPLDKSPEVLRERSRELIEKFGYHAFDSHYSFEVYGEQYVKYLMENDQSPERLTRLASGQPAVLQFLYRTSPQPIVPLAGGVPSFSDPPMEVAGMTRLRVDTKGRLVFFEGVPARVREANKQPGEFDWASVFKEAGFDIARFQAVDPQWTPRHAFDEQRAFSGTYPADPDIAIRVEAAAYQGKLTSFEIISPWTSHPGENTTQSGSIVGTVVLILLFLAVFGGSAWLALRNFGAGRSDLKNAFRVAVLLLVARIMVWAFTTHHVASFEEFGLFMSAVGYGLSLAVLGGVMYLAFEPYLRKIAPERVIAWNRLLAGEWRDPLVGRDILIGAAGNSLTLVVALLLTYFIPRWQGKPPTVVWDNPKYLSGISIFPAILGDAISAALIQSFVFAFLLLFFGLLLRRKLLGAIAVWLIVAALGLTSAEPSLGLVDLILFDTVMVLISARFGVLATLSFFFVYIMSGIPFAADLTAWYAGNFILFVLILVALSFYGFYTSVAGQTLWQGKLLEEA